MTKADEYIAFLNKYLGNYQDALLWVSAYGIYTHDIDDIIDCEIPTAHTPHEFILKTFEFAETVYTNIFYLQNIHKLRPLIKAASNAYMDSVILEKSDKPHHKHISDHLRTVGNELILAVIEIVSGIDKRREASLELREISYSTHHTESGVPI